MHLVELVELRVSGIFISSSHVKCFVQKSKNDQYREGAWVVAGATGILLVQWPCWENT